jgi:hypothetical protein
MQRNVLPGMMFVVSLPVLDDGLINVQHNINRMGYVRPRPSFDVVYEGKNHDVSYLMFHDVVPIVGRVLRCTLCLDTRLCLPVWHASLRFVS